MRLGYNFGLYRQAHSIILVRLLESNIWKEKGKEFLPLRLNEWLLPLLIVSGQPGWNVDLTSLSSRNQFKVLQGDLRLIWESERHPAVLFFFVRSCIFLHELLLLRENHSAIHSMTTADQFGSVSIASFPFHFSFTPTGKAHGPSRVLVCSRFLPALDFFFFWSSLRSLIDYLLSVPLTTQPRVFSCAVLSNRSS